MNESAALSGGHEDNLDKGREASESATLNEGCRTQDDFLAAVVTSGLLVSCGSYSLVSYCLSFDV